MILLTFLLIVTAYFISWYLRGKKTVDYIRSNFKSAPSEPIIGHIRSLPLNAPGIFSALIQWFEQYGKNLVLLRPINHATLLLTDPNDIETLLANTNSKMAQKSDDYLNSSRWLGEGLLLSSSQKWYQRRKIITPTFHFNILEGFAEVMGKQSDIFLKKFREKVGGEDIEIYTPTSLFALDVICETSMGISINAQGSPDSKYVKAVKEITTIIFQKYFTIFNTCDYLYDLTSNGRREKQLRKILHDFTDKAIIQRRELLLNRADWEAEDKRTSFLDMLLNSTIEGKPLTNADIREEVDTFMFEGHDTTASGIAFALYFLAQHKIVQDRLYAELVDALGDRDTMQLTYRTLADIRYLDMVVKETLRMRPSIPFIGRKLTEDTVLNGVKIPAGINAIIGIFRLHNDPDNFPDPKKFDPDRFDPVQAEKRHPFSYIPFSAGGRNCIGQKFALMELKMVIVKMLMHYELLPALKQEEPLLQGNMVLSSVSGLHLRIVERQAYKKQEVN